ncbi:MAG: MerR family DNA-binding transcriptional regulator [Lachnospiraceae bacterium]|nr:MerR family DNA-binding transcriptional regulator [Lachnospiraceae bacterium]
MNTYRTAEIAAVIGIHTNTVRLYEEWGLISKPERKGNGYRVYSDEEAGKPKTASRLYFRPPSQKRKTVS